MAAPALDPDRFFLKERVPGDDLQFRAPARRGVKVTPLIDARRAYGEMEKAILAARSSVHLCLWEFEPFTRLVTRAVARSVGGHDWIDLLLAKAQGIRGRVAPAHVRVIIADSDPLFYGGQHAKTWAAFELLAVRRSTLSLDARARFEMIVGIHPALVRINDLDKLRSTLLNAAGSMSLEGERDRLNAIIASPGDDGAGMDAAEEEFANRPGLWAHIHFDATSNRFALTPKVPLSFRPASHHQKLCLVDGRIAFCGGLDIVPNRIDDAKHGGAEPWHDIQCAVEGAPVFDMERDFFRRWNEERERFGAFVDEANEIQPPFRIQHPDISPMRAQAGTASFSRRPGTARVQIVRTLSGAVPSGSPLPEVIRKDIEECYLNAIARAEQFIYIENQYTHWLPLAEAIIARHATRPIKVIVVTPTRPEEVRSPQLNSLIKHGIFLQNQFLRQLADDLGADLGTFALSQRRAISEPDPLDLFGSPQIYVHSKIMIVDDVFATIGSANANGRGFFVDSEVNIAWASPSAVRAFRLQLWAELLGRPPDLAAWKPEHFVLNWQFVANVNRSAPAGTRIGFVVPNDPASADAGARFALPEADKLI